MPREVTVDERRARLARRHLLLPADRTDDVVAIADALVALHSSDPVTVYLSVLARMADPSVAAVENALYADRSLIRHHAMRRTLWVARPEVVRRMHAAATRKLATVEHRRTVTMLQDSGIDDGEAWLAAAKRDMLDVLHEQGPMTARELGRLVPALAHPMVIGAGKAYEATVAAHTRVLLVLGFEGALVRTRPMGTWINGQYTWAAMDSWLPGGVDGLDEREAARDLAAHWLRRFGPGTSIDLQWWMGWTVAMTRRALADCGAVTVELDGSSGWVAADDEAPAEAVGPWTALLPGLDPTIMGWKQRDWYLPVEAAESFDSNGNAGPTVWVDGQVVGAWAQRPDGEIRLHWFVDVPPARRTQVEVRADELRECLGATRFSMRFPGRINTTLLA